MIINPIFWEARKHGDHEVPQLLAFFFYTDFAPSPVVFFFVSPLESSNKWGKDAAVSELP